MSYHHLRHVLVAVALGLVPACDRPDTTHDEPGPRASVPSEARPDLAPPPGSGARQAESARASTASEAVYAIAAARCDRERRCGHGGGGAELDDSPSCEARVRADWRVELSAYECPGGVAPVELDACLTDIRAEDCASMLDTLERVLSCRSSAICTAT